jgi:tyrosine-protein phosphatase SIW14
MIKVNDKLWRGPRPQPGDFAGIKTRFKTVISLEGEAEDLKEADELAPVCVISKPISFQEIYFTGITQLYLSNILDAIQGDEPPVLVHCQHGEDRTGLVIAAYRVMVDHWTKDEAMREALKYGYRNWLNFGLNKTWKNFPATWKAFQ